MGKKQEKEIECVRSSVKRAVRLPVKIAGDMAGDFMKGVSLGWGAQSKVVKGKCPFCGK
jgi:hypothetical protein